MLAIYLELIGEDVSVLSGVKHDDSAPEGRSVKAPCTTHLSPSTPPQVKSLLAIYLGLMGEVVSV